MAWKSPQGRFNTELAIPFRAPILPKAALYLGIIAAGLIAGGLVVGIVGALVAALCRPAGLATSGIAIVALALAPPAGIGAIVSGHMSLRRYPHEGTGRTGLIIGYCVVGSIALLAVVGLLTWQSIR